MKWLDTKAGEASAYQPLQIENISIEESKFGKLTRSEYIELQQLTHEFDYYSEQEAHEHKYRDYAKKISNINLFIIFFLYPGYLIVMFVIWAVRTLRSESS
jgi:hypothetical protein